MSPEYFRVNYSCRVWESLRVIRGKRLFMS